MSTDPTPSYHVNPDWSITPPPDGHLTLGTILKNYKIDGVGHPLNVGAAVEVPKEDIYPRKAPASKTKFYRKLSELRSFEGGLWAKLLGGTGPGASLSFMKKSTRDDFFAADLLTRYFSPSEEYMKKSLELPGVATYVNITRKKRPVYMITGLKIAVGARLAKESTRATAVRGEGGGMDPYTTASGGGNAGYQSASASGTGFEGSSDFVIGFRLRKIWWKNGVRLTSDSVSGSTLTSGQGSGRPSILNDLMFVDDFSSEDPENSTSSGDIVEHKEDVDGIEASKWIFPEP